MKMIKESIEYKDIRYSSGLEIEELLGIAANFTIKCENCAIKELCAAVSQSGYHCAKLWAKYLKGEIHGEA